MRAPWHAWGALPRFWDVLDAILPEVVLERVQIAEEAAKHPAGEEFAARFPEAEKISHEDLKMHLQDVRFVVRTGEATPYANVILTSGVPF